MNEQEYWRDILAINSANLAANLENININSRILQNGERTDSQIIAMLQTIIDLLKAGGNNE
ncbi:MAG: hypothetical protein ACI4W2_10650 [Eubacterium sp.]